MLNNRLDLIIERLDRILNLLDPKHHEELLITFNKANPNVDMPEIKQYEQEIYKILDKNKK